MYSMNELHQKQFEVLYLVERKLWYKGKPMSELHGELTKFCNLNEVRDRYLMDEETVEAYLKMRRDSIARKKGLNVHLNQMVCKIQDESELAEKLANPE